MKITDEMIRSGALVLCPHLDQLPAAVPESQRHWYPEGYSDQAAVLDDARMVLEAGLIAAPPVEYAGLVERLRTCIQPIDNPVQDDFIEWNIDAAEADMMLAADAITALEARAREAEKAKAEISTEWNRVQDLYFAAEARIRELEAALSDPNTVHLNMLAGRIAKPTVMHILHLYSGQLFHAAVLAEREACAEVADDYGRTWGLAHSTPAIAIAAAIRARTQATNASEAADQLKNQSNEWWDQEKVKRDLIATHSDILSDRARTQADAPAQPGEEAVWLIRKGGYFYRPNRAGYTSSWAEAGRYTKAEAEAEAAIEPWHMRAIHQDDWHRPAPAQPVEEAGNGY